MCFIAPVSWQVKQKRQLNPLIFESKVEETATHFTAIAHRSQFAEPLCKAINKGGKEREETRH